MRPQMCLQWIDLEYSVPVKKKNNFKFWKWSRHQQYQTILKKANGCMNTGDLIAILGPSGAGKTTLLAAISQRIRGSIKGDIALNGIKMEREDMTNISTFLPQFDITIKSLTAFEHLFFMSHFKMDKSASKSEKAQKVNRLLLAVGLRDSANTRVSLMSGGERKRLSLAEELITDPPFVFCDEPTTGLDSFSARSVVQTLRQLTKSRRVADPTPQSDSMELQVIPHEGSASEQFSLGAYYRKGIMCSIHQPTSDIFELFTHVILMDAGQIIYSGSLDDACLFFSKLGFFCPLNCNPADFYIKIIADSRNEYKFGDIIRNNYEQEIMRNCPIRSISEPSEASEKMRKISWFYQIYLLILRTAIDKKRNIKEEIISKSVFMLSSITLAIMYSNVTGNNQSSVQDIEGCFFLITTEIIFTFSYTTLHIFPANLPQMRRGVGEGTYSLSAYYIAQAVTLIPNAFVSGFLFFGIIYSFAGFSKGFLTYLTMSLTVSLAGLTGIAYGMFLSSIFESDIMAAELAAPLDLIFLLFGGIYLNLNTISPYFKFLSFFYFANEALAYDYWRNVDFIECSTNSGQPCLRNGTEVLEKYAFSSLPLTLTIDHVGLILLTLGFHILSFIGIRRYVKRSGFY